MGTFIGSTSTRNPKKNNCTTHRRARRSEKKSTILNLLGTAMRARRYGNGMLRITNFKYKSNNLQRGAIL